MQTEIVEIPVSPATGTGPVKSIWVPCEYELLGNGQPRICSLGDVEREEVARKKMSVRRRPPDSAMAAEHSKLSVQDAAREFFEQIAKERKIVVLLPDGRKSARAWPWKRLPKSELIGH